MKERKRVSVRIRIRPEKERSNDVIKIAKNKKAEINEENIKFKNNQFFFDEMYQIQNFLYLKFQIKLSI